MPEHDLLFLGRDLKHPRVVAAWVEAMTQGYIDGLVAEENGTLVGTGPGGRVGAARLALLDRRALLAFAGTSVAPSGEHETPTSLLIAGSVRRREFDDLLLVGQGSHEGFVEGAPERSRALPLDPVDTRDLVLCDERDLPCAAEVLHLGAAPG